MPRIKRVKHENLTPEKQIAREFAIQMAPLDMWNKRLDHNLEIISRFNREVKKNGSPKLREACYKWHLADLRGMCTKPLRMRKAFALQGCRLIAMFNKEFPNFQ